MLLARRGFLKLSLVGAIGAFAALVTAQRATGWPLTLMRALYHRLLSPSLGDAPTGSLSTGALGTLLAATRALIGLRVEMAHYEDFFRWRAENLLGYKDLYEQFAEALDRHASRLVGCNFSDCGRQVQQKILEKLPHTRNATTRWQRVRIAVLERKWLAFDQHILRDILLLFYRTDAWTELGYDAWPGMPRGLDRYTQAPRGRG
jgi:hypothetical protein